jgi:hypothetical protein
MMRRATAVAAVLCVAAALSGGPAKAAAPNVLRVGTWKGVQGTYPTIQAAVDAAQPGDWVLVGPGDWHEKGSNDPKRSAGVLIEKPNLHLRGMDRNTVIVDGTNPTAAGACDPNPAVQDQGPVIPGSNPVQYAGRNGIEVYSSSFTADGVSIENLTACNFLANGNGSNGNEIWWNGGDGSGKIGMGALSGAYLTASSSYNYGTDTANKDSHQAKYGIFTSNEKGPGVIAHSYASNMGDSDYYIGACSGDCNLVLTDAHAQNSALGFSGTNSGGHLIIQNSEFDNNLAGIGPNTLNNDDAPSPADGICPGGGTGPTGSHSCSILANNYVHDNNYPNTPSTGIAGAAPVGTGVLLSGVRNFTVIGNRIENNGSWGVLVNDFPDTEPPRPTNNCAGGIDLSTPAQPLCYFAAFGNEVTKNAFKGNGSFGNAGGGDIAQTSGVPGNTANCYHDDTDPSGVTTDPPGLETLSPALCSVPTGIVGTPSLVTLLCASGSSLGISVLPSCPAITGVFSLPARTGPTFLAIPHNQPTMPDPCAGVPANPWCAQTAAAPDAASAPTLVNTAGPGATAAAGGAAVLLVLGAGAALGGRARRRRLR